MTLQQMEYFIEVAKKRHYTRAAEALHVSQPSLSYAIKELEKELGIPLFQKRNNNLTLSSYGEVFLGYCNKIMDTLEEAKETIQSMQDPTGVEIRLGYSYTQFHDMLPRVIRNFWDLCGEGQNLFRLRQGNGELLRTLLLDGDLDVALSFGLEESPLLVSVPIQTQELYLAVPESHPLAGRESCTLREIGDTPLVLLNRFLPVRQYINRKFAEEGLKPNVVAETNDNSMSLSMVEHGVGASVLPYSPTSYSQNIRFVRITDPRLYQTIYFSYHKNRYRPPQIDRFIQHVLKTAGTVPEP